jgi:hypothetical protein
MKITAMALILAAAVPALAETYRVAGKPVEESELKSQYAKVDGSYVLYNNALATPEQVGAVRQAVEVLSIIDPYTVLVKVERIVSRSEKPAGALDMGSRKGREFTIAETNARLTATMQTDDRYALRLREKSTDLPMSKFWNVWVCDSKTFVEVKKKDKTKVKLRVLYDVTMRFEDFVALLQRGQVFPELAEP